jgi:peptide/nickel transport system ATP-binding protein
VLDVVRLPDTADFLRRYPHQLSGGQQQRACLAIALAAQPALIVLDEPATGLDRPTRSEVLDNVRSCCDSEGLAVLLISHDLEAVTDISDRVVVMRDGRIVEEGPSSVVLDAPVDQFTRRLVAVTPATCGRAPAAVAPPPVAAPSVLAVHDLTASHRGRPVVRDATFDLRAGECLALVGDSAAGKTTLARSIVGLHHDWTGTIGLDGAALARRSRERTVAARRAIQYVFQNPALSLNPRRTIGASVARPLLALGERRSTAQQAAILMLERVSLPAEVIHRWPREMSGGELQRAAIARALVVGPRLLLCDEVTASLDPIVQATILELLRDLQRELGLSILLISHDHDVVGQMAHRVVTLSDGTVEVSSTVAGASPAAPAAADQDRRPDGDHQLQR